MRRRISGSNTQPPSRVYTYPYAQPPTLVDPVSGRRFPFCPQINGTEETAQRCGLYSTNDLAARIDRSIDRWTNRKTRLEGKKKINAAPMTSDIRFRARKKRASFSADRLYTLALLSIPRVCNLLEAPCSLLSLPTRSFTPVLFRPSFSLLSRCTIFFFVFVMSTASQKPPFKDLLPCIFIVATLDSVQEE